MRESTIRERERNQRERRWSVFKIVREDRIGAFCDVPEQREKVIGVGHGKSTQLSFLLYTSLLRSRCWWRLQFPHLVLKTQSHSVEREIDIHITKLFALYCISQKAIGEITRLPRERERESWEMKLWRKREHLVYFASLAEQAEWDTMVSFLFSFFSYGFFFILFQQNFDNIYIFFCFLLYWLVGP